MIAMVLTLIPTLALPVSAEEPGDFFETVGVRFQEEFKMIYVEGGTFTFGWDSPDDLGFDPAPDTAPVENVTVSSFYISETELTQALWAAVMNTAATRPTNPTRAQTSITWYDCNEFLARLYVLTGKVYRMCTEAEWEYAAKGGKEGIKDHFVFSGSNVESQVVAPTQGNVKQRAPNQLGIYDMSGNVEELVWNAWYSGLIGGTDPVGIDSPVHAQRTRRGGTSSLGAYTRYASARQIRSIDGYDGGLGLRIALSADQTSVPLGMTKPFDIRIPKIDDRDVPNSYRDPRWITGDDLVWDGDFVGIFGGATMKVWEDGSMVIRPHNVDGSDPDEMHGQWYTVNNIALVLTKDDGERITISYIFMEPDLVNTQNNRTRVFMAPTGRFVRQPERDLGLSTPLAYPNLTQELIPTDEIAPGNLAAENHQLWDMDNIPLEARGQDPRLLDGPDHGWWMGFGAGGEHTYRKDFDLEQFRFSVYQPGAGGFNNPLCKGAWYTVNDLLLVVLNSQGVPVHHYTYFVVPLGETEVDPNSDNPFQEDASKSSYDPERPVNYPLRHLTWQDYERGDSRLFGYRPNNEVRGHDYDIPITTATAMGSTTFRKPPAAARACPGIPGEVPGTYTTCGHDVYNCTCPVAAGRIPLHETVKVDLSMRNPVAGAQNNADARAITILSGPAVTASITTTPWTPTVASNGTFAADTAYTVTITLAPRGDGFPDELDDLVVTVNGAPATVTGRAGTGNVNRTVQFTFPATDARALLDNVAITMPLPLAGGINNAAARTLTVAGGAAFATTTVATTPFTPEVAANGTFELGVAYDFEFTLVPGATRIFPDDIEDLAVTVNGIVAEVTAANGMNRTVKVTLPPAQAPELVSSVALAIPQPVTGGLNNAAARTASVIAGNVVATTTTTPFLPNVANNGAFQAEQAYTITVTLAPQAGYVFDDDLDVTINGNPAATIAVATGGVNRTVTYVFPATAPRQMLHNLNISMPAPAAGGTNNAAARTMTVEGGTATATLTTTPWSPNVAANGTFAFGTEYTLTFTLAPGAAYFFPTHLEDLVVRVNGIAAVVTGTAGTGGANRTLTVTFPATIVRTELTSLALEMPVPAANGVNNAAARNIIVEGGAAVATATVPVACWSPNVPAFGIFKFDTAYSVSFTLAPGATHFFPEELDDLAVTVNGLPAVVTGTAGTGGANRTITYTFPVTEEGELLSNVAITMPAPAAYGINSTEARAMTVAGGADVATTNVFSTPWAPAVASNGIFKAYTTYRLTFTLIPGDSRYFPENDDDLTVTVNGIPAKVIGTSDFGKDRLMQVTFGDTMNSPIPIKASIRTDGISYSVDPLVYTLSVTDAQEIMSACIEFVVDGNMMGYIDAQALNGFSAMSIGGSAVAWKDLGGGMFKGSMTLLYGLNDEAISSDVMLDIANIAYKANKLGDSAMTLTKAEFAGRVDGKVVWLNGTIADGEAKTTIYRSKYDLNKDGTVDLLDLTIMKLALQYNASDVEWNTLVLSTDAFGAAITPAMCDFNGDGIVDMLDLVELFLNYIDPI